MALKYTPTGQLINYDSSHLANLGYTGKSNSDFDSWYRGLNEYEKEYVNNPSPVLLQFIKAYNSADDYHKQQLDGAYRKFMSQSFSPTLIQQMGELFGDTAARQNFANVNNATFSTDISGILEAKHTEDYTDPSNELARRKEAGINDDLSGGQQIGSGSPGSIDEQNIPSGIINDGSSSLPEIGTAVAQVFSMSMGLAQSFQNLSAGAIQLATDKLSLLDSADNFLISQLGNRLTEEDIMSILNKEDKSSDTRRIALNKLQDVLGILTEDKRLPRSVRKAMSSYHGKLLDPESIGVDTKLYSLVESAYQHKKGAIHNAGDPFTKGGFEDCLEIFGKYVNNTVISVQELKAKYEKDRLSVIKDGKSLGSLAGESDANAFTAESYNKEFESIQNEMWSNIMSDLKKQDTWWSKILLFAIPIVRIWLTNSKMPSVSHSTSSN